MRLSATHGPACFWAARMPISLSKSDVEAMIQELSILIVDDNQYMRKVVRTLLVNIGVRV